MWSTKTCRFLFGAAFALCLVSLILVSVVARPSKDKDKTAGQHVEKEDRILVKRQATSTTTSKPTTTTTKKSTSTTTKKPSSTTTTTKKSSTTTTKKTSTTTTTNKPSTTTTKKSSTTTTKKSSSTTTKKPSTTTKSPSSTTTGKPATTTSTKKPTTTKKSTTTTAKPTKTTLNPNKNSTISVKPRSTTTRKPKTTRKPFLPTGPLGVWLETMERNALEFLTASLTNWMKVLDVTKGQPVDLEGSGEFFHKVEKLKAALAPEWSAKRLEQEYLDSVI